MKKIIKNAFLVDKDKSFFGEVLIENGIIKKVSNGPIIQKSAEIIDAKNKFVIPAFVDLHVHFRDPGFTYKEDLESGAKSALRGGFTTVNLMANTNPICDSEEKRKEIEDRAQKLDLVDMFQVVSVTKNFDGKNLTDFEKVSGKFLSDDGKGVLSDLKMYEAIKKSKECDKIIMVHAENEDFSKIDYRISEDLMTIRDIYLAKYLDAKIHFSHVSTIDSINAIRNAKREGVNITCEVSPHHIFLSDLDYKVHPPIRTKKDNTALIKAIKDGVVDVIATDHAPHTKEDKENGSPGLVGLETSFCVSYTKLVKEKNISLNELSKLMSYNGAKLLGVNKGLIEENFEADLVFVDLDKKIKINPYEFASKSRNTPFENMEFYGEVLMTMKKGDIKYRKDEF